ncbi:hypothetical protein FNT36_22110 [Hymenobacter setariae]|uniref:Uncharacterized protein n=1 Tax=Hymenobacter setariae TaxID=2594794 RepID=A0A558BMW9_9BACT|nr:hypothetical protein [Hymenobacter setariae]TVT37856.1 hypothetical protein FNT36_22110 [Hymenobacter setariae]
MSNSIKELIVDTCISIPNKDTNYRRNLRREASNGLESGKTGFLTREDDLQSSVENVLLGLFEAERDKPVTSALFKKTKYILCCVLGLVPGYRVLMHLWSAVVQLRSQAQHDSHIGAAHIIVQLPGRGETALASIRFDILDDAPHGH